jgi:hypothetical protein
MFRVIIAVVLTAVVQFAWGFGFYGYFAAMDRMTTKVPDTAAVGQALRGVLPESGTYILPMCPGHDAGDEAMKAFEKAHTDGPLVQIHYRKDGIALSQMPVVMGMGFGHMLLTVLLAAFLLRMALPGLPGYLSRMLFVFGLGVFAALYVRGGDLIWFHHHWQFELGQIVFCVGSWLLGGLVMAALIRPAKAQGTATQQPSLAA